MAVANVEVCPWCRCHPVTVRGPWNEPTCRPCLATVRAVRCRCGTLTEPFMGLYEVFPNGVVRCCHCLGSVRCGIAQCEGCDVCCDPQPNVDVACHWCGTIECAHGACLASFLDTPDV